MIAPLSLRRARGAAAFVFAALALVGPLGPLGCERGAPAPAPAPAPASTPPSTPAPPRTSTSTSTPAPAPPRAATSTSTSKSTPADSDLPGLAEVPAGEERRQVVATVALIRAGGPFPYPDKDGSTFGNYEGRLPARPRGYYREYTVPTPGLSHRGPRRVVSGRGSNGGRAAPSAASELFYTRDHYESFVRLTPEPAR